MGHITPSGGNPGGWAPWQSCTMLNSFGGSVRVRKSVDGSMAQIDATGIFGTGAPSGTAAATIPSGYQPPANKNFAASDGNGNWAFAIVGSQLQFFGNYYGATGGGTSGQPFSIFATYPLN